MFTRFNISTVLLVFFISFFASLIVFGENGILENREKERYLSSVNVLLLEKERDVVSLSLRTYKEDKIDGEKSLIYSFDDEAIFDPAKTKEGNVERKEYNTLSRLSCFFISLSITFLYIVFLVILYLRKRRKCDG